MVNLMNDEARTTEQYEADKAAGINTPPGGVKPIVDNRMAELLVGKASSKPVEELKTEVLDIVGYMIGAAERIEAKWLDILQKEDAAYHKAIEEAKNDKRPLGDHFWQARATAVNKLVQARKLIALLKELL
jgi:hypothetical protein